MIHGGNTDLQPGQRGAPNSSEGCWGMGADEIGAVLSWDESGPDLITRVPTLTNCGPNLGDGVWGVDGSGPQLSKE
jgi:hypothetical protein